MRQVVIENPVINSVFAEPTRHFKFTDDGTTDEIVETRGISSYFVPVLRPKKPGKQPQFDTEWTEDRLAETDAVNRWENGKAKFSPLALQQIKDLLHEMGQNGTDLLKEFFTTAGAGVKTNLLFFTKGQRTGRIWYYDLTDIKVHKKTPLTLKHFEDFVRLLPSRADSPLSWTVDMDERKRVAAEEAQPFKDEATAKGQQAAQSARRLADLRKARPPDDAAIEEAQAKVKALTREAKALAAKAKEIDDAVYDLKAVNPNKRPVVDARTPKELMDITEVKGRQVAEALAALRAKAFEGAKA